MSRPRAAVVALHALVTFAVLAATSLWVARGRHTVVCDLPQDYAGARAWLDGDSPYRPLGELSERYGFGPVSGHVRVHTNPHPPVGVLLTVPYALADYETALRAVRWTQLVALALAWALSYEMFRPAVPGWAWALAGGALGLWGPVWQGIAWGQPVGLLALGTLTIWWLARTDRRFGFGFALAAVTLIRPFSAIMIVLAFGWPPRWRRRVLAGLLTGGLIPFALVGITPWEWYRLASDAAGYVAEAGSLPAVLGLGAGGGEVLFLLAAVVLAWFRAGGLDADSTAALAAVAGLITYPLAWFQYDVSLVPVVAWVVARAGTTGNRVALWGLTAYLLLRAVPDLIPTPEGHGLAETLARNRGWLQVLARCLLLAAVAAVVPRRVSANAPS